MKQKSLLTAAVVFAAIILFSVSRCSAEAKSLHPISLSFNSGVITQGAGNDNLYFVTLNPKFNFGNFTVVAGLNVFIDNEFRLRDDGNDTITIDSAQYEDKEHFKLYYGDIENLTLGSGFIVSNYRSNINGNIPLNRQKGLDVEVYGPRSMMKFFTSKTRLKGFRAVRNMGKAKIGTTVVSDNEPDFDEVGLDIQVPLLDKKLSVYAEDAKIQKYGEGYAAGVILTPVDFLNAKIEFRHYDADFIPGIVDEHYEARPLADRLAASAEGRQRGYYSALDLFGGKKNTATITYEDYEEVRPRMTFLCKVVPSKHIGGNFFYAKENFLLSGGAKGNAVGRGELDVAITRRTSLIFDYYRGFDDAKQPLNSFTVKAKYKLK